MKLMTIASGSSGNCAMVGNDHTTLLCDAGISLKKIEAGMNEVGLKVGDVSGLVLTHEHSDHIKSVGVIMRKFGIPVYATEGTIRGVMEYKGIGKIDPSLFRPIKKKDIFKIGDIEIRTNPISHDAYDPVCYSFHEGTKKAVIATDMGCFDDELVSFLKDADAMVIEANHDVRMLEAGSYPYELKRRILGNRGHLSNCSSGQLILKLLSDHVKAIMLGHLSKENNFAELAYETVRDEIVVNPFSSDVRDFNLFVAARDNRSELCSF